MKQKKYPEGHFKNQWAAIGIPLGLLFGLPISQATGNPGLLGIGLPIGFVVGLTIGTAIEEKAKKEGKIRPLTKKEKERKNRSVWIGLVGLLIGMIILLTIFFLR